MTDVEVYRTNLYPFGTVPYPRLTDRQHVIWTIYLPDYSCSCPDCEETLTLEMDTLSEVPTEILTAFLQARGDGYFDLLQLWSSEDSNDEHLLVGIVGDCDDEPEDQQVYQIARWGVVLDDYTGIEEDIIDAALEAYADSDHTSRNEDLAAYDEEPEFSFGALLIAMMLGASAVYGLVALIVALFT